MRFKPILFSTEMVRAILEGRKTQTRRLLKSKHLENINVGAIYPDGSGKGWIAWSPGKGITAEYTKQVYPGNDGFACPYGAVGDVLWVRETFIAGIIYEGDCPVYDAAGEAVEKIWYRADKESADLIWYDTGEPVDNVPWKPSIHMPKSACRIFLQITDIRVERLQDISEEDAKAEGVLLHERGKHWLNYQDRKAEVTQFVYNCDTARKSFQSLWDMINGWHAFGENPWVWALTFTRIDKPEGFV